MLLMLFLPTLVLLSGCSVGATVAVTAKEVDHPVSYTNSFYSSDDELVLSNDYEELNNFSFTFTKWGVSSWIEIRNSEDISNRLNKIIEKENGDAITNLKISINNPSGKNGLLWFSKVITISASALFTFLAIADDEHRPEFAAIAAGSTLAALFTPAAVDIKVEGTVVKLQ
jgi:predicted acylesterase/phospholipase RssA